MTDSEKFILENQSKKAEKTEEELQKEQDEIDEWEEFRGMKEWALKH